MRTVRTRRGRARCDQPQVLPADAVAGARSNLHLPACVISFVWSPGDVLPAGTGGSENYTTGHVRELNRRGVPAQVVTVGLGEADGREQFTDIPFVSLAQLSDVSELDDT